jgi:hypothetical protein
MVVRFGVGNTESSGWHRGYWCVTDEDGLKNVYVLHCRCISVDRGVDRYDVRVEGEAGKLRELLITSALISPRLPVFVYQPSPWLPHF